ncbi:hypothetical protein FKM82_030353 [Ascaphus truei]
MFRKYKMKVAPAGGETQEEATAAVAQALPGSFLLPPKVTQSLPHCTPVSSPTLGEANVASGKATQKGSGHHFAELHRSARAAITSSVRGSPPELLEDWLAKTKEEEERPKSPVKSKSSSRVTDPSQHSPGRDVWLAFDGVRLLLRKLLSQLETFMFPQSCPFPHVIRAGAVFIPIHLVKERMFRELPVASVDRVLQRHKVELRPTTLSEEKLLRDTELRDCSSRMLKLLALKQLPDVYPDLLHLYWGHCVQRQLGEGSWIALRVEEEEKCQKGASLTGSADEGHTGVVAPRRGGTSLVLKLQRVCHPSGNQIYKAEQLQPPQDKEKDTQRKGQKRGRKRHGVGKRTRFLGTRSKKRCMGTTLKAFPDLVGKRIMHLFDDGGCEVWFAGRVLRVHRRYRNPRDTQYEVWYDGEPGTQYFLELLQDYERGWLRLIG